MTLQGKRIFGDVRKISERVRERREAAEAAERSSLHEAARNFLPSLGGVIKDLTAPIHSPIDTARSLGGLAKGIVSFAIPGEQQSEENVRAVGRALMDRYGSFEAIRDTFRNDPAGLLADAAGLVSGGSTLALKAPGMIAKTAALGRQAGRVAGDVGTLAIDAAVGPGAAQAVRGAAARAGDALREGGSAIREGAASATQRVAESPIGQAVRGSTTAQELSAAAGSLAEKARRVAQTAPAQAVAGAARRQLAPERLVRGAGAVARAVDPARHVGRAIVGTGRFAAQRGGAAIARGLNLGTDVPAEQFVHAYRTSRDNTLPDGTRAPAFSKEGSKAVFRAQMRRETPLDQVVEDIKQGAEQTKLGQRQRFIDQLGESEGQGPDPDPVRMAAGHAAAEARGQGLPPEAVRSTAETAAFRVARDKLSSAGPPHVPSFKEYYKQLKKSDEEAVAATGRMLRENPEMSAELATNVAERRKAIDTSDRLSEASRKGWLTRRQKQKADETVAGVRRFFGAEGDKADLKASGYGSDVSDRVRNIMDAGRAAGDQFGKVIDSAIEHGKLSADELADLWALRRAFKPTAAAKISSATGALTGAARVAGKAAKPLAKPALRASIAVLSGAALGGSRWAQRRVAKLIDTNVLEVPRAIVAGTRGRWRGSAGAKAGARIAATKAILKPVTSETAATALGDAGKWAVARARGQKGVPLITPKTRKEILKGLRSAGKTGIDKATDAAYGGIEAMFRSGMDKGDAHTLKLMRDKLASEIDLTPGDRRALGAPPDTGRRPAAEEVAREAGEKISMGRVALALDEAVSKTFKGIDLNDTTRKVRAEMGRWVNDFDADKSLHNVAGADALLARFDNAIAGTKGDSSTARILREGRDAIEKAVVAQAPPSYKRLLDARKASGRHLENAEKALSLGHGGEVALRKVLDTIATHGESSPDKRLRKQYLHSLGVSNLEDRLAGISMDRLLPPNFAGKSALLGGLAGGAYLSGGAISPLAIVLASTTSPRAMGELVSRAGGVSGSRLARGYKQLYTDPRLAPALLQAGRLADVTPEGDVDHATALLASLLSGTGTAGKIGKGGYDALARALSGAWRGADAGVSAVLDR